MKRYNIYLALLLAVFTLLILDFVYIASVSIFYKKSVKHIQGGDDMRLNIYSGILCYVIMIIGLVFITFTQLSRYGSLRSLSYLNKLQYALRFGGILGFVIYGVFNTTNMAIFKRYSIPLAIIDIIWGTILYTIATYVYLIMS
jgi:uncharacterized membrane protein